MHSLEQNSSCRIKQQHLDIFTLRSINSEQQILQLVPVYQRSDEQQQNIRSGHWTPKEHVKYIMFLDFFQHIFQMKHNKKLWKIFTIMAEFIKTRNSSQCRSHHQKTQRKYKSVQQILKTQRQKYKNYDQQYQVLKSRLRNLPLQNPPEIQKQKSTTDLIPSIKVLQENIEYKTYRNSLSMIDILDNGKRKSKKKSKAYLGSQKLVEYNREKYIGSQCSIQMQDQSQECIDDDQKPKPLSHPQRQIQSIRPQNPWQMVYQVQHSQKKDEKMQRTADSYFNQAKNAAQNNSEKIKIQSQPGKQTTGIGREYNPLDLIPRNLNFVRMKKCRSSLPSFEFVSTLTQGQFEHFGMGDKKQSQPQGKCKTLPPRSQKSQSQQSWISQKPFYQQPLVKTLFSGFVSSLSSGNKGFDQINNFNSNSPDQYTSFNNFCNKQFQQEMARQKKSQKQPSENNSNEGKLNKRRSNNYLFCDDMGKGNLCNQLSDAEFGSIDESIQFVAVDEAKSEKHINEQNQSKFVRNFSKKLSNKIEQINSENSRRSRKSSQRSSQNGKNSSPPVRQHPLSSFSPLSSSNFRPYQAQPSQPSQAQAPYQQLPYQQAQNNTYPLIQQQFYYQPYQQLYNVFYYPTFQQFVQFYVYFLIQKIFWATNHTYHQQYQDFDRNDNDRMGNN